MCKCIIMLVHKCTLNSYFHSFLFRKGQVKLMDDMGHSLDTFFRRFLLDFL